MKIIDFNPEVRVHATGLVIGDLWGGGTGSYKARKLHGKSVEEVMKLADEGVKTGSLDSGMGFERLTGAALTMHIITTIEIEGKEFENIEYETVIIGDLSEATQDFLIAQL